LIEVDQRFLQTLGLLAFGSNVLIYRTRGRRRGEHGLR
jgi:hypothetical protein